MNSISTPPVPYLTPTAAPDEPASPAASKTGGGSASSAPHELKSAPAEPVRSGNTPNASDCAPQTSEADTHKSRSPALTGVRMRVQGRRLEKLLLNMEKRGIHPRDVRRESLRAMSLRVSRAQVRGVCDACAELNIEVTQQTPLGITLALVRLRRRAALPLCAALCVLMLGLMSTRVWRVHVDAPQELRARVESALEALGVAPGAAKSALNLKSLETAVTAEVPDVKFCQARVRGVTFTLTAQKASAAPETLTLAPPGGLYARCDAVVERIQVLAGHAAVERGDTVRAGDLLIAGEERVTRDKTAPVRALGIVTGRIWYEGLGEAQLNDAVLERTGRTRTRRVLRLFDREFVINGVDGFAVCDREITTQPIGGLFLPLSVETVRFYELTERTVTRGMDEAKAIAGQAALQNALKKCPDNAFVIDKWAEYSIIEGNIVQARYIMEVEETIQCGG